MRLLLSAFVFFMTVFSVEAAPVLDIQKIITPKGLEVWFVQDKHLPMMALQFSVRGGAQFDPKGKDGTAEMLSTFCLLYTSPSPRD